MDRESSCLRRNIHSLTIIRCSRSQARKTTGVQIPPPGDFSSTSCNDLPSHVVEQAFAKKSSGAPAGVFALATLKSEYENSTKSAKLKRLRSGGSDGAHARKLGSMQERAMGSSHQSEIISLQNPYLRKSPNSSTSRRVHHTRLRGDCPVDYS